MNSFQTIILGIFAIFIIAGLITVALVQQKGQAQAISLSMWGSVEKEVIDEILRGSFNNDTLTVSYREIPEYSLDQELLEALASRRGPDMVLLPLPLLMRYRDKLQVIPYSTYTERAFKDNFIQEGDLFLFPKGVAAFPFLLDPLVMYYNRDLLDEVGRLQAPRFWDEFISLGKDLTLRDDSNNISRSAVGLGAYRNINHAREILAALFLQGGSTITGGGGPGSRTGLDNYNMSSILDFYTEFANPQKPVYSWNRSLPDSKDLFLSTRLGIYFGFGSEYEELRKVNPNLNFDVALFPRPRNASVSFTYGKLTGVSILRTASSPEMALQVALTLTSPRIGSFLHSKTRLPPVQRSLLVDKPTDAYGVIMYDSATRARGFLDPNPKVSAAVFRNMIESVTSGRTRSSDALRAAQDGLEGALR